MAVHFLFVFDFFIYLYITQLKIGAGLVSPSIPSSSLFLITNHHFCTWTLLFCDWEKDNERIQSCLGQRKNMDTHFYKIHETKIMWSLENEFSNTHSPTGKSKTQVAGCFPLKLLQLYTPFLTQSISSTVLVSRGKW